MFSLLPTDLWLRPAVAGHLEALMGRATQVLPPRFCLADVTSEDWSASQELRSLKQSGADEGSHGIHLPPLPRAQSCRRHGMEIPALSEVEFVTTICFLHGECCNCYHLEQFVATDSESFWSNLLPKMAGGPLGNGREDVPLAFCFYTTKNVYMLGIAILGLQPTCIFLFCWNFRIYQVHNQCSGGI